ncbi:MAG TPA: hypothetical protein VN193_01340 [Candidatus Angelobacter sp.]|jgi:hypothetical protein|nr:hypothetical protein [Candidatus Angelobacter sp.]
MSKRNRHNGRPAQQQRQAIRDLLDEVPADLIHSANGVAAAVYEPPAVEEAGAPAGAPQRRGWLGLRPRRGGGQGQTAVATPGPQHHLAFEVERRAQRLEDALAAARAELAAAAHEVDEAQRRAARFEGELADAQDGRAHWERVASEQLTALDELGAQLGNATAAGHAEREAHEQTRGYAGDLEGRLTAMQAQWQEQVAELTAALGREREEFQRTLEDERHTAEQAHAEQAFQHREQVERFQAEATAAIDALHQRIADGQSALEAVNADLGTTRAEVVRLNEDVEAARGEAVAATTRARESDDLRLAAEQRIEELGEELAYVRSEVMGSAGGQKKSKGLFGRGKPAPVKAAEKQTRAVVSPNDVAAPPVDPDVEDIIERRLFGSA